MGDFVSGAIAFEFSMENNEYGLVLTPGFLAGQERANKKNRPGGFVKGVRVRGPVCVCV